jgi:hypothetical protein
MGLDFIRKTAPTFKRALDRRAVALRSPKLFGRDIPLVARSARANVCHGAKLKPREKLLLRVIDTKLIAQRENVVVAEFPNPPAELLNQVQCGAGIEEAEVKSVHPLSETVEIAICE